MLRKKMPSGIRPILLGGLLFGTALAKDPVPDPAKIRAGAQAITGRERAQGQPPPAPEYPISLAVVDSAGREMPDPRFTVPEGQTLSLALRIENRGDDADEFNLGGTVLGVKGEMPKHLAIPPRTQTTVPITLVKESCAERRKGGISLLVYPIKVEKRYRGAYASIVLQCP